MINFNFFYYSFVSRVNINGSKEMNDGSSTPHFSSWKARQSGSPSNSNGEMWVNFTLKRKHFYQKNWIDFSVPHLWFQHASTAEQDVCLKCLLSVHQSLLRIVAALTTIAIIPRLSRTTSRKRIPSGTSTDAFRKSFWLFCLSLAVNGFCSWFIVAARNNILFAFHKIDQPLLKFCNLNLESQAKNFTRCPI